MFKITKNVIDSGRYELRDMLGKLDALWLQGNLSDSERAELVSLARANVTPEMGYAPISEQIAALNEKISALEERIASLEALGAPEERPDTSESPGETPESPEDTETPGSPEAAEEYPAWKTPTGAHDAYYTGSKMTYTDGRRYECTAPDGYAVTYGPDVLPGMWSECI